MTRYIGQRLLSGCLNVLLVSILVFVMVQSMPGDAANVIAGEDADPATVAQIREELGLTDPLFVQYLRWAADAARADFGDSFVAREPVASRISSSLVPTVEIAILATLLSVLAALPLGIVSAIFRGTWFDHVVRLVTVAGMAIPNFWLATLAVVFPALWIGWTLPFGYKPMTASPSIHFQLIVPAALILAWAFSSSTVRIVRSTVLEVLRQDYVRTAQSKGLRARTVVIRHALPNSLLPTVSIVGTEFAILVGGTVIVEHIFGIPGIGRLTLDAIVSRDYPQIQANVVLIASFLVVINLVTDLSYGWLDPRVRLG